MGGRVEEGRMEGVGVREEGGEGTVSKADPAQLRLGRIVLVS